MEWVNARQKCPNNYRKVWAIIRLNDMGEPAANPCALYYDFRNKEWCEKDPSFFKGSDRSPLGNWFIVEHWAEIEYPCSR